MGNFEKLGILVIIILVVVILVLAIWGVGVPPEELFVGDNPANLSTEADNGGGAAAEAGPDVVLPPEPRPDSDPSPAGYYPRDPAETREPGPAERPAAEAPEPPSPTRHVVKKDETLIGLARVYYGDGGLFRRILDANPGIDPNALPIGAVLRIPDVETSASAPPPAPPSGRYYVVREGDNLSKIARRLDTTVRALYDANRAVIGEDPSMIRPEMRLVVPR